MVVEMASSSCGHGVQQLWPWRRVAETMVSDGWGREGIEVKVGLASGSAAMQRAGLGLNGLRPGRRRAMERRRHRNTACERGFG